MDPRCRISMLGSLRVQQGGREMSRFRSERTGALLAYLSYHLTKSHPREVLAETIWPGSPPGAGRDSLNTALSALRRQLEPPGVPRGTVIQGDRFAVHLNPEAVTTDVQEFEAGLRGARDADSIATRVQHLTDAVGLYRGELLPGFYDEWVITEQRRLADQYFEAALGLSALRERAGDREGAVAVTREAIARDPLREEAHYELMRLHAACGEPVAALRHYAELKDLLAKELGQEPSPATAQLAGAVRAAEPEVRMSRSSRRPSATAERSEPASGMVTFLLTDIEGGMALSESMGEAFEEALETYRSVLGSEFRRHGAQSVREAGTSFVAPFANAMDAMECAVACQELLAAHPWPQEVGPLRVRMALYTGDVWLPGAEARDGVLKRASRLLSVAHGGQVLCGEATAALLKRDRQQATHLTNLGTYRLRDVPTPEKLFQVSYSRMHQVEFPALRAEAGYADNLPLQLTRFFGRKGELEELQALVRDDGQRLVTLTGPGGSGKTRLVLEVARKLLGHFNGAVWFVPLADLRDADLIPGAIADALGLQRSPHLDPLDQVASVLREQSSLLILDNLEQLGQAAGPVVRSLLDRSRSATCLATSRRPLDLPGERLYAVPPLLTPEAGASAEELLEYASVRLFIDRAQAARPDFQLTESNAQTIAALCERLDGVPLAIELAAARAQAMTTGEMLAQLHRPFDFLVSRRRVTEERHATLEAAIDWSYQLLPDELQRFFASMSIFRGGCTCEAAQAVCGEPRAQEYLEELTTSSLLTAEETQGVMRFRPLETLREFASECLDHDEAVRLKDRHVSCLLGFAKGRAAKASGPEEVEAHRDLEAELENLRAALEWSLSRGQHREFAELTALCGEFLWRRGYWAELAERLEAALEWVRASAPPDRQLEMTLLRLQAQLEADREELVAAEAACRAGLTLARGSAAGDIEGAFLNILGRVRRKAQDPPGARRAFEESLAVFRSLGDRRGEGLAMHNLALLAQDAGKLEAARRLYEEALPLRRASGDLRGAGEVQNNLGLLAEAEGRWDLAAEQYRAALAQLLEVGDVLGIAVVLSNLGEAALRLGDGAQAVRLLGPAYRALAGMSSVYASHTASLLAEAGGSPPAQATQGPWRRVLLEVASEAVAGTQSQ